MIREKGEALSPVKKSIAMSGAILLLKGKDSFLYAGREGGGGGEGVPADMSGGGREKPKTGGGGRGGLDSQEGLNGMRPSPAKGPNSQGGRLTMGPATLYHSQALS